MLEKDIEKKVNDHATKRGALVYKFVSPNRRGVPDRMYAYKGTVFFIEFKQTGKKPSALQEKEHRKLRRAGMQVFVVDDVDEGKKVIDSMTESD